MKKLLIIYLISTLITVFCFSLSNKEKDMPKTKEVPTKTIETIKKIDYSTYNLQTNHAVINHYSIYGTNLNMSGSINISNSNIERIELVLIDVRGKETAYNLFYNIEGNTLKFNTSQYINSGINLENIHVGSYDVLIKVTFSNMTSSYYLLLNKTNYSENIYYTLTKNHSNNEVKMKFISDDYPRFNIQVTEAKLPHNVYDIVIDPGHGGRDSGTSGYSSYEKNITLEYGKRLKEIIEQDLGLKVAITRTTDETLSNYEKNGRVDRISSSKAKYGLSIHLNNTSGNYAQGGVEIYAPTSAKLDFAKKLADNIVKFTNTNYSSNPSWRVDKGVYVRALDTKDIKDIKKEAEREKFIPYDVKDNTTYYFIIRETGGIVTNAYVDGRNKKAGKNIHYLDNVGVETYLLELGYINNANNMKSIINDKEKYVRAIVNALKEQLSGE